MTQDRQAGSLPTTTDAAKLSQEMASQQAGGPTRRGARRLRDVPATRRTGWPSRPTSASRRRGATRTAPVSQRRVTGVSSTSTERLSHVDPYARLDGLEFGFRSLRAGAGLTGMGADVCCRRDHVEARPCRSRSWSLSRAEVLRCADAGAGDPLDRLREAPVRSASPRRPSPTAARARCRRRRRSSDRRGRAGRRQNRIRGRRGGAQKTGCGGQTILVGDTAYDIEAAAGAGVATIALRCGGWRDKDLEGAIAIYDDPADLLAHADTSPLASILAPMSATS